MSISISRLQQYIREMDYNPGREKDYFLKLAEEVGELARAMRKNAAPATPETLRGTVEEELYDILYYTLAIANLYDIDLETWAYHKEKLNDEKYGRNRADQLLK